MSFRAAVLTANISQMVVKLVNEHIRVVEILLIGYVDRFFTMDIASKRPLLPARASASDSRHYNAIMLGEGFKRVLRTLVDRTYLEYAMLELALILGRIRIEYW